jgi:putative ABC transport system permease protein
VAGSFGGIYAANRWLDRSLLGADLRPLELAGLALLGIVTGLVAAVLPARAAARQDVVAALRGRMGVTHTRRRLPTIGLAVAVVGAALALGGGAVALAAEQRLGSASDRTLVVAVAGIVVGAVLTQIGLILATPAIVGAVGRLGRWLPLAPRLALRDAARYRARTAPAVAAILAAVAGSVAVTLFVSGTSDHDRREYTPSLAYGQAVVNAQRQPPDSNYYPPTAEEQVAAVQRVAPPDDVFEVRMLNDSGCVTACRQVQLGVPPRNLCALDAFRRAQGREPTVSESLRLGRDPRCTYSSPGGYFNGSGPVVGGYEDLVRLTGIRSDAARRALAADGMVVFDQRYVDAGQGQLELTPYDPRNQGAAPTTPARVVTTPAAYVPAEGRQFVDGFVSPALAARIGVTPVRSALVLQYETPPSDDVEERVSAELSRLGGYEQFFQVERGYRDNFGIGLLALVLGSAVITLGAAGVATGLAQADGRADHATLAAVGAPPRVRRSLAAWQAAVVGGLGVGLGTLSGFVPMTAYLYADSELRLVPPWRNLALIVVVVPAVAAAGAWLLTRSRLPLERRMEA